MKKNRKFIFGFFLMCCVLSLSGCSLLQIPAVVISGVFKLVGQLINFASKLPKPPPGVFGPF